MKASDLLFAALMHMKASLPEAEKQLLKEHDAAWNAFFAAGSKFPLPESVQSALAATAVNPLTAAYMKVRALFNEASAAEGL